MTGAQHELLILFVSFFTNIWLLRSWFYIQYF